MKPAQRANFLLDVVEELKPWIEVAQENEVGKVAEAGIQIRRLLREASSVARGIDGKALEVDTA